MIGKRKTAAAARKSRTRIRKPKFLSLRLQLISPENPPPPSPPMPNIPGDSHEQKQLINLFPLHPENLHEEQNMACIFSSCDDDGAATTLTGLLCSDDDEEDNKLNNPSPSSSVNYADEEFELVRTAMRRNKTEMDHNEKWVCYSEVVERKCSSSSLASSSSCNNRSKVKSEDDDRRRRNGRLVLKLDYEEIMNAWVDKGPLYIHRPDLDPGVDSSQPQTVPDLGDDMDDFFSLNGERSGNGGVWIVPEMVGSNSKEACKVNKEVGGEELPKVGQREASVQRYKEKRRNRLFAKTIRYQVRKLNAEKRPRLKGRFVKRS